MEVNFFTFTSFVLFKRLCVYNEKYRPTHSSRAAGTLAAFPLFPQLAPEFKL